MNLDLTEYDTDFAVKTEDRFQACSSAEDVWLTALDVFSVLGPGWLSFAVINSDYSALYGYRTSMPEQFLEPFYAKKLFEHDYFAEHMLTRTDLLVTRIGEPFPDGRFHKKKSRIDPLFLECGVKGAFCQPFRDGDLFLGVLAWVKSETPFQPDTIEESSRMFRTMAMLLRAHYNYIDDPESIPDFAYDHRSSILSRREVEALGWLAQGHQTQRIATEMGISVPGVKKHFSSARRKLNARTREHALAIACRYGLIATTGRMVSE